MLIYIPQTTLRRGCCCFFTDQRLLVSGARVGLPTAAAALHERAQRQNLVQAGCDLDEARGTRHGRLVQTYARDTGAIVTVLTVPLFVKQCRWGVVLLGWNLDGSR